MDADPQRIHGGRGGVTDLDMQGLLPSLFALVGTLAGTFGGILTGSRLTTYRLEQLEKKVEKHNSLVERTYRLEGQVSLLRDEVEHYTER